MNFTFVDLLSTYILVYLDDISVYSKDLIGTFILFEDCFLMLKGENYILKRQKGVFGAISVKYLGHVVCDSPIIVDPKKIEAISTWLTSTSIKEVPQFIGFASYYNDYIQPFAEIATPLTNLLSPKKPWSQGSNE